MNTTRRLSTLTAVLAAAWMLAGFDSSAHLIWIIHSANETGYR